MAGENEFDMAGAVGEVGAGLGFGGGDEGGDNHNDSGDDLDLGSDSGDLESGAPTPKPVGDVPGDTAATPVGAKPTIPAPGPDDPPRTWTREAAAKWALIDPEVRTEILKREQDIFKGLEGYKEQAGFGKSVRDVLSPYMPILQQYNIDPVKQVAGLMNAHYLLATGTPDAKLGMMRQLAKDYNVDLGTLTSEPTYVDPEVLALRNDVNAVRSQLSAREVAEQQAREQENSRKLDAFIADKVAHPHFDEVANDIADLMVSRVAKTLEDAYEKAVWANPVTRAKEQARIATEAATAKAAEEKARAEKARAAARANVRTTAKNGSAAAPLGSMDDTLSAQLAEIRSRG